MKYILSLDICVSKALLPKELIYVHRYIFFPLVSDTLKRERNPFFRACLKLKVSLFLLIAEESNEAKKEEK